MEKQDVSKYLDRDVYQVEVDYETKKKIIHIDGYCYFNDETYQMVQGTFRYMDIDGSQCTEKAEELFSETKQYQGTVTLEDVIEYYKDCTPLPYDQVTQDTPCGRYVN